MHERAFYNVGLLTHGRTVQKGESNPPAKHTLGMWLHWCLN